MLAKTVHLVRNYGPGYFAAYCADRLLHRPVSNWERYAEIVSGKNGIEFGGPSHHVFGPLGIIPIYDHVGSLDNCNFAGKTEWEGSVTAGLTFNYSANKPPGLQFVTDASGIVSDPIYDFVLSSHMLEHSANPLKVVYAWKRIMKPGAALILLLPDAQWTFDHRRKETSLAHLIADFDNNVSEDDLAHLPEILELHDLERDKAAGDYWSFKQRSYLNFENRCLHQHVFGETLIRAMMAFTGFRVTSFERAWPHHLICSAKLVG